MQIGFFTTDWSKIPVSDDSNRFNLTFGGTFYHRGALPAMELNKHGYDNHLAWRFQVASDGHIRTMDPEGNWHDPDVLYTQRWMSEHATDQMLRARASGQIVIADLDDDFWSLGKTNSAYYTTDPKNNPTFNRDHYWNMLGACDAITVSTRALQRRVEKLNVPTYIVRNAIDINQWEQNDPSSDGMIGWIGGIQWRAHDLEILRPSLPQFLTDHDLPIYHGGDSSVAGVPKFYTKMGIDPTQTRCVVAPLCQIHEYTRLWAPLNVSLIPLERCGFNESKSWLKALESCAAGIPYIVSDGLYEQKLLIEEGAIGRTAKNEKPAQWRYHLDCLLDPDVRVEEGKINRKIAEQHHIGLRWTDWDDVYKTLR